MIYIAILSDCDSSKILEEQLLKIGYYNVDKYTTNLKETSKYNIVTEEDFKELEKNGNILCVDKKDDSLYGNTKPFGHTKYVDILNIKTIKELKKIYNKQIITVYINKNNIIIGEYRKIADLVFDEYSSKEDILSGVLKRVRRIKDEAMW